MAATLSAGVNSLILKLDTPYDTIRTTDIRDDLIKVLVWCSASPIPAVPLSNTLVFDGLSLSIVIPKLADGTTLVSGTPYYVKYAFISDIQEDVYTVSSEYTATPVAATSETIDISGYSAFVRNALGTAYTPATAALTAITNGIKNPVYAWTISGGALSSIDTKSTTVTPSLTASSVTVSLSVLGTGLTIPIVKTIVMAIIGEAPPPPKYATATLYKWSSASTPNPTGRSTYTWSSGTNDYYTATDTDGWSTVVPTNPGTSSLKLWSATKTVTAPASAITTEIDWTTGVMIGSIGGNGAIGVTGTGGTSGVNGINSVTVNVYKAGLNLASVGSPAGTSLYTWATGAFDAPADTTWTKDPPLPSSLNQGLTLWAARVTLIESAITPQSTINWAGSAIVPISYYGANGPTGGVSTTPGPGGASARVAYVVTSAPYTTPATTPENLEVQGDVVPTAGTWFPTKTWVKNAPANPLVAGEYLYQVDGLYNPVTLKTNWIGIPYLSNLKVGNLSALAINTGALTVNDTITVIDGGEGAVLIKPDGISIFNGPPNARVLRVKLGSI
jgi:hypothetical protein